MKKLLADGMTEASVMQQLAAIRLMFAFMVVGTVLPVDPACLMPEPQCTVQKRIPSFFSADNMSQLFGSIDTSTLVGLRDRALIALLGSSSFRVRAAVGMKVGDYYFFEDKRWIRLRERSGEMTESPCPRTLSFCLDEWVFRYGRGTELSAPMFPTLRYGKVTDTRIVSLPAANIYALINKYAKIAGLKVKISAHGFHTE